MLLSTNKLIGYVLNAEDGRIGEVSDLLFDDRDWSVRYVVARTMKWLGREVILAPESFGSPEWESGAIPVELTKAQIKDSPSIAQDAPVSRQQLTALHSYFGWSGWWASPVAMPAAPTAVAEQAGDLAAGDPNLRSTNAVTGMHIEANDGEIGHVEDFIVDTDAWRIRYTIVDTGTWLPGKKVYGMPDQIREIDYENKRVRLDVSKQQVEESTEFDPTLPINREVEVKLLDFYGRPYYWG